MKKLAYIIFIFLFIGLSSYHVSGQDLMGKLTGKWKVIKYQSKTGTQSLPDTLEFQTDGTFLSDSIYFNTTKGRFRTEENSSVLRIDANNITTEWSVSLKNGVLRLRSVQDKPKTYITLVKVK